MKLQKTPIALAAFALCASLPFAAQAAPTVSFKKPANNATISGVINQTSACEATGSNIDRIKFYLDSTLLNTEESAPWNCNIDTRKFSNGTHTLKAVAYDTAGASKSTQISVNISNGSTNTPPAVSISSPGNGATVSGTAVTCGASASDSNGIKQVQFFLDGTALGSDTGSPYTCVLDTTKFANGTHTLKAVATDGLGATSSAQISLNIQNSTTSSSSTLAFTSPAAGATLKGTVNPCTVNGLSSTSYVRFYVDGAWLNTDTSNPWTCNIDTTKFKDGAHALKAIAYNSSNVGTTTQIAFNIQNAASTTTNTPPAVAFTAPAAGATLSGMVNSTSCAATASDSNGSVAKVDFYLGPTLVTTKTAAPYQCAIDTTKFANGTHTLMAVATDNLGASASTQRSVTINNTPPTPALPSTNTKAIATFESLGLYWTPPSNPGAAGCNVRFRKQGEAGWNDGLAMWYDARNSECRGSLVHLAPDTSYEVQFSLPGQQPVAQAIARTWSESFPIAQTVHVSNSSQPLDITQGGTANGYVLYTPAPGSSATIDVAKAADYNIKISAPYVIVRGLTLKGGKIDGIVMVEGAHDVVIEDNDISEWGRWSGNTTAEGWKVAVNKDSAIKAYCTSGPWLERTIIQRNKIHHPSYGSNSWSQGHPLGSNAIFLHECGGNHVWRYNQVYSEWGRYFMDAFGGSENFSTKGFLNSDSDVYGNVIQHVWDDAIEAEGANRNVRIWGNYMDQTATGVASTSTSVGPIYIFRNVWNRSRMLSAKTLDLDQRAYMFKSGSVSGYGDGRRYVFHNTMLQAPPPAGSTLPLGGGEGLSGANSSQILTNTVSRNNIYHIWKSWWSSIDTKGGAGNDVDYDLRNGNVSGISGAELNGIVGTPIYAPGHGWSSEAGGNYQLDPSSPGYDRGVRLPNFNDGYTGAGPDMGAHEAGTAAMRFGVSGGGATPGTTGSGTTTGGTTPPTGGVTSAPTTGGTPPPPTSGGVCSSAICVVTQ